VDDATLDAFGTDGDEDGAEADDGESGAASDAPESDRTGGADDLSEAPSEAGRDPPEAPDSVVTTYAWAEAGRCEDCGADSPGRWREGDTLVCADCASWQ
jgi:hypothetical protein